MTELDRVLARFPEQANDIRRLCLRDARFRSICEDLVLAYKSLGGPAFEGKEGSIEPEFQLELAELRDELEHELLAYLNGHHASRQ